MVSFVESLEDAAVKLTLTSNGRRNIDDAFWICDIGEASIKIKTWKRLLPRVRPCFAMKAAPHPTLIKFLLLEGAGLDCATQGEIDLGMELGCNPCDIVLSNTNKQISHLQHARSKSVNLSVYDSEAELLKAKKYHSKCNLLVRIKVQSADVTINLNDRFGASLEEAKRLIILSKDLGINTVGVCFHVGSGCYDDSAYTRALTDSRVLFDYAAEIGLTFNILDIGGGFRGIKEQADDFEKFSKTINEGLSRLFNHNDYPELQIIAEPGKYFCTSVFTRVTNVINKREGDGINDVVYTVNDGIFGALCLRNRGILGDGENEPTPLNEKPLKKQRRCRIDGPTCSGIDMIVHDKTIPEMEIGDWLLWKNCGSYTFALASEFNCFGNGQFYDILTKENRDLINEDKICELSKIIKTKK